MKRQFILPPLLIKFGKKKNIDRLYNGSLRFGTYEEYRKSELDINGKKIDTHFNDSKEGLIKNIRPNNGVIRISSGEKSVSLNSKNINLDVFQGRYSNLFCCYGFSQNIKKGFRISKEMKKFGDTALIFDSKLFLSFMFEILSGSTFDMNYVSYYPESTFNDNLSPFSKRDFYSYQMEYRIATSLSNQIIDIGNYFKHNKSVRIVKTSDLLYNTRLFIK